MGVNTKALINSNVSEFVKALNKVEKAYGKKIFGYNKLDLSELKKGKGFFISVNKDNMLSRSMYVNIFSLDIDNMRQELPKHSRKLKNAKNIIYLSMGSDKLSQGLLINILQAHTGHGYIMLSDCGEGANYLEVGEKGIIKDKWKKLRFPEKILAHHYNDMETNGNIEKIKSEDLKELNVQDIKTVYYIKQDATKEEHVSSTVYYSDIAITYKDAQRKPSIVEDTSNYVVMGGRHIQGKRTTSDFIEKLPSNKRKVMNNKNYYEEFPIN